MLVIAFQGQEVVKESVAVGEEIHVQAAKKASISISTVSHK